MLTSDHRAVYTDASPVMNLVLAEAHSKPLFPGSLNHSPVRTHCRTLRCSTGINSNKSRKLRIVLRLFPSCLSLSNIHHRQRVHEFHRGYELWGAVFILGELEDEHNLHKDIRIPVIECAVGYRLCTGLLSIHQKRISVGM